jgi:hypothetical protein
MPFSIYAKFRVARCHSPNDLLFNVWIFTYDMDYILRNIVRHGRHFNLIFLNLIIGLSGLRENSAMVRYLETGFRFSSQLKNCLFNGSGAVSLEVDSKGEALHNRRWAGTISCGTLGPHDANLSKDYIYPSASTGDAAHLKPIIANGADPDFFRCHGLDSTALIQATQEGHTEFADLLISYGAGMSAANCKKNGPLFTVPRSKATHRSR